MRSYAGLNAIVKRLRDGIAGDIIMVKAQRHAAEDIDHNGTSKDWFFNAKRSGDVINEQSVHNLDVCNWLIGARPESACGSGGTLLWKNDPPGRTNMDGYSLSYEYTNGVRLSYTQVFFHPSALPGGGSYYYVYGTKGAVDVLGGKFYPRDPKAQPEVILQPQQEHDDPHVVAFFEAVRTNGKRFYNPNAPQAPGLREALRWKLTTQPERSPVSLRTSSNPYRPAAWKAVNSWLRS